MDIYCEQTTTKATDSDSPSPFEFDDTWIKGSGEIPLPCDGVKQVSEAAPKFVVEVYYRKLTEVIESALSEPVAEHFHTFPCTAFWKPSPDEPPERAYSETYPAMFGTMNTTSFGMHMKTDPTVLEAFIVGLMIWFDVACSIWKRFPLADIPVYQ